MDESRLTYMGADTLGRYLNGEEVTWQELKDDSSPSVHFWLSKWHCHRLARMLRAERMNLGDAAHAD